MSKWILFFVLFNIFSLHAQYAPAVGEFGTTAISKDSSIFQFWADSAILKRGWQNSADKKLGFASFGKVEDGLGNPDSKIVSLGDSGEIILSFPHRIINGVGPDFAVFENSFNNTYLELAFVEVSSDGKHFIRFPSVSLLLTMVQLGNDAVMDATKIDNLAGKYKGGFGTPFDLEILKDSPNLDVNNVRFVKLIDVVGSVNSFFGTKDSKGNLINDPFPTPYPSSGFDLDAVGVINSEYANLDDKIQTFKIWPNPASEILIIDLPSIENVFIFNSVGESVYSKQIKGKIEIDLRDFERGFYFVKIQNMVQKIIIQ